MATKQGFGSWMWENHRGMVVVLAVLTPVAFYVTIPVWVVMDIAWRRKVGFR